MASHAAANRRFIAAIEVALVVAAVITDRIVPTLVILLLCGISLAIRRASPATLGFHRLTRPWRTAAEILLVIVGWTFLHLALFMPVLEHLTGDTQDVSDFEELHHNLPMLIGLLALTWTLAAIGEELAYRGYLLTRIREVIRSPQVGVAIAVLASSTLFAFAHREQGAVGVGLVFLDSLLFCALRFRYRSLWASVLGHGFSNTIGLTAYYLVGPVTALW